MQDALINSFGRTIAFIIPGMGALAGVSLLVPELQAWFGVTQPPTVGGFLFVMVASIGLGVFVSGLRWLLLDRWLMPPLKLDQSRRSEIGIEAAYRSVIVNHYQFYQCYANASVALVLFFVALILTQQPGLWRGASMLVVVVAIIAALLLFANDASTKYAEKAKQILGSATPHS